MRREGRQHGTVRTFCVSPASPLNPTGPVKKKSSPRLGSPPTAGIFTRVPVKPTNHSKFTGKCGRPRCSDCHLQPCWKSKDKIKGARTKPRSTSGLEVAHGGLLEWRVLPKCADESSPYHRLTLATHSASDILYQLRDDALQDDDLDQYCYNGIARSPYIYHRYPIHSDRDRAITEVNLDLDSLVEYPFISSALHPISNEIVQEEDDIFVVTEDRGERFDGILVVEEEDMGFYDVAIVWDPIEEDEGWSLIGEI